MVIRYANDPEPASATLARHPAAPAAMAAGIGEQLGGLLAAAGARLRRRLPAMLVVGALPFAVGFAYLKVLPPLYTAEATVFVDPAGGRPGRADSPADQALVTALMRQATSRPVLQRAIEKDKLADDPAIYTRPTGMAALVSTLFDLARRPAADKPENRSEAILRMLGEQVAIAQAGEVNLLAISARAGEAGTAARLANSVAQAFVDEVVTNGEGALGAEKTRIDSRIGEARRRLADAETRLVEFRQRNGIDHPAAKPGAEVDLAAQLTRARAATIDLKAKSDQIQKLLASGKDIEAIADLVRSPSIERLRIQYNEAVAQEANFRTSLGPRHPSYLEAAEQARERRRLLQEGLRLAASSVRADWQAARDQELALEKRVGADINAAPAAAEPPPAQLRELERTVETARLALERAQRSQDSSDAVPGTALARIVARASEPTAPNGRASGQVWTTAATASLALSALVFAAGWPRRRSKPALSLRGAASVPPPPLEVTGVAAAPAERPRPSSWAEAAAKAFAEAAAVDPVEPLAEPAAPAAPAAPAPDRPADRIAREFAERETNFALQMVLVTADEGVGHQVEVALSLANAAARLAVRVLLIDSDAGEAPLSRRCMNGAAVGILSLSGRDRLVLAVETAENHLVHLVPNEAIRPLAANDSGLRRLRGIAGHFDLVIVNAPATADVMTLRALARNAQSVVVASNGQSDLASAAHRLGVAPANVRQVPEEPSSGTPPPQRPMAVVRMPKCA